MVKTVFSIGLSTGENLVIKKNRLEGTGGCGKGKRVAVVSANTAPFSSPGNIRFISISSLGILRLEVEFIRADCSGVFIPSIEHNHFVKKGDKIGEIITPIEGTVEREIIARKDGLVFTLREYPMP